MPGLTIIITVLFIILILSLVLYMFESPTTTGARDMDIAESTYNMLIPYIKEQGTTNIVNYLEDRYDYAPSKIRSMRRKSKVLQKDVGSSAYFYYLVADIIDLNHYNNAYEFISEADIDYSAFVSKKLQPHIIKFDMKYTKVQEKKIKNIFNKAGIKISTKELQKFLKENRYFKLKGKYTKKTSKDTMFYLKKTVAYEPDIIGLLNHAYIEYCDDTTSDIYIPKIPVTKIIINKPTMTFLEQLRYERALLDRLEIQKNKLAMDGATAELERVKKQLLDQQQQIKQQEAEAKAKYVKDREIDSAPTDRSVFELQKSKYKEALMNNETLKIEALQRRNAGEDPQIMFDEWLIKNNMIIGLGDASTDVIEPWEKSMELSDIL